METGTQKKGRHLRAKGAMSECTIGEGLMCTAEGKLTPEKRGHLALKPYRTCLSRVGFVSDSFVAGGNDFLEFLLVAW